MSRPKAAVLVGVEGGQKVYALVDAALAALLPATEKSLSDAVAAVAGAVALSDKQKKVGELIAVLSAYQEISALVMARSVEAIGRGQGAVH